MKKIILFIFFASIGAYSQTSGPKQPEFSSFGGVTQDGFVNEFDGSFNYTIDIFEVPGPDGVSFPIKLSYASGVKPSDEASWVGLGWILNNGSIVRNVRGYPDDYNGDMVTIINKRRNVFNFSLDLSVTPELFSFDKDYLKILFGLNSTLMYNNITGLNTAYGLGWNALFLKSLNLNLNYQVSSSGDNLGFGVSLDLSNALNLDNNVKNKFFDELDRNNNSLSNLPSNSTTSMDFSSKYSMNLFNKNYPSLNLTEYHSSFMQGSFDLRTDGLPHLGIKPKLSGSLATHFYSPEGEKKVFGYMYIGNSVKNDKHLMDYYSEGNQPLQEKEEYLNIPFANSDQFVVLGAGLSGGFKLFHKDVGTFRPNEIKSFLYNKRGGFSLSSGFPPLSFGTGLDLAGGSQVYTLKGIKNEDIQYPTFSKQNVFFRFNNDKAGSVQYTNNLYNIPKASVNDNLWLYNTLNLENVNNMISNPFDAYSSSNIKFNLVKEHKIGVNEYNSDYDYTLPVSYTQEYGLNSNNYSSYKQDDDRQELKYEGSSFESRIRNFEITNKEGMVYKFGLPVYNRKERTHSFFINDKTPDNENRINKYIDVDNANYMTGTEQNAPYAGTYLLTSITGPNYIDRSNDGPSNDDIGGWVRFKYLKTTTNNNLYENLASRNGTQSFYSWRMPYYGLNYDRNSLSDRNDDVGSVMFGEKEIFFLDKIETKTHIAIFYKSPRYDSYQALPLSEKLLNGMERDEILDYIDNNRSDLINQIKMMKLDSIKLFFKNNSDDINDWVTLKTAKFEYDYSLCGNMINNINLNPEQRGKLTLKKVWFEHYDVKEHKIEPYLFKYEYPDYLINPYPPQYSSLEISGPIDENPDYSELNVDAWGNYAIDNDGVESRTLKMKKFVNQNPLPLFDPAAWNLKQIRLPSGGEIHMQYEQNEYSYIQDQIAMRYVPISEYIENPLVSYFKIKYTDIQDGLSPVQKDDLLKIFKEIFITKKELIHYNLLWELIAYGSGNANLTNCKSEYLDGFVKVTSIAKDDTGFQFYIDKDNYNTSLPRRSCIEYVKSFKSGKLDLFSDCSKNSEIEEYSNLLTFLTSITTSLSSMLGYGQLTFCNDINTNGLSYLRIPDIKPKKGGGIRVKRILFYDKFNEEWRESEPMLYGKEYLYVDKNGIPSGVATNEPVSIGDENSIYRVNEKRIKSTKLLNIISGNLKDQYKYPFCSSLLPAANVNYSSIITKNIFEGNSEPGFKISEYFTTRDYPFDYVDDNGIRSFYSTELKQSFSAIVLPFVIVNFFHTKKSQTQSYRFLLNQMNGQKKREANYSGIFSDKNSWVNSNYTEYEYFNPFEKIPIFKDYDEIDFEYLGTETELFIEGKKSTDLGGLIKGNVDKSVILLPMIIPPIPIPILFPIPLVSYAGGLESNNSELATHVINKVISHPVFLKSITNYKDGKLSKVENVAFDKNTGEVALKRFSDGFDGLNLEHSENHKGLYHEYSFFGSNHYNLLDVKSKDENVVYKYQELKSFRIVESGEVYVLIDLVEKSQNACVNINIFNSGDVLRLTYGMLDPSRPNSLVGYYQVDEVFNNKIKLITLYEENEYDSSIPENSGIPISIEIVEASEQNRLNEKIGSIVTYGEDVVEINGKIFPKMDSELIFSGEALTEIDARYELVENLNMMVTNSLNFWSNKLSDVSSSTINVLNNNGDCVTLNPDLVTATFTSDFDKGYLDRLIKVCIENDISHSFNYSSTYHPLVEDLNHWLDRIWSTRLDKESNLDFNFNNCYLWDNDDILYIGYGEGSSTQTYINQMQIQYPTNFEIGQEIRDLTGMTKIENSTYYINGHFLKGNQIIKHLWAENSWDKILMRGNMQTYMTKIYANGQYATYVGRSNFIFSDELSDYTNVEYENILGFSRHFDRYGYHCNPPNKNGRECRRISDCGNYNLVRSHYIRTLYGYDLEYVDFHDWDKGYIDYPTLSGYTVYDAGVNDKTLIDYKNEQMWEAMGYDGYDDEPSITFTKNIGKFYLNEEDGKLYYKRIGLVYDTNDDSVIDEDDDILLEQGQDVPMFQLMPPGGYDVEFSEDCCFEFYFEDVVNESSLTYTLLNHRNFFYVDEKDGFKIKINYEENKKKENPCSDENFCITFCDEIQPLKKIPNVIAASSSSYTDDWNYLLSDYGYNALTYPNDFKSGNRGKLRQSENFVYNTSIIQARGSSVERVYSEAGVYDEFELYNWEFINSNSPNWLMQNKNTKYSPDGKLVESKNILDIYSSSRYGYDNHLVEIVANNAEENSYDFESYEYLTTAPTSASISNKYFHSGKKSLWTDNEHQIELGKGVIVTSQVKSNGLKLFLWVKSDFLRTESGLIFNKDFIKFYSQSSTPPAPKPTLPYFFIPYPVDIIAQTGEWSLYTTTIENITSSIGDIIYFSCSSDRIGSNVWIDDFKVQPLDANVNCYVYDNHNYQLMTSFDDQHFGLYYDYNFEGQLIRKRIETEKGMKTITEQQHNTISLKRGTDEEEIIESFEVNPKIKFNRGKYLKNLEQLEIFKGKEYDGKNMKFEMLDFELNKDTMKLNYPKFNNFKFKQDSSDTKDSLVNNSKVGGTINKLIEKRKSLKSNQLEKLDSLRNTNINLNDTLNFDKKDVLKRINNKVEKSLDSLSNEEVKIQKSNR